MKNNNVLKMVCTPQNMHPGAPSVERLLPLWTQYFKTITTGNNDLLKRILEDSKEKNCLTWIKNTSKYFEDINTTHNDTVNKTRQKLKEITKAWDTNQWKEEIESKSVLYIYKHWKEEIKEAQFYDNRSSSTIMYKARTNCLPLHYRKRHTN